jgi:TusA-related sulfurtransferase
MGVGKPSRSVELRAEDSCLENPVARFEGALDGLPPGGVLEVFTHGADHTFMVKALAKRRELEVLEEAEVGTGARILLRAPPPG